MPPTAPHSWKRLAKRWRIGKIGEISLVDKAHAQDPYAVVAFTKREKQDKAGGSPDMSLPLYPRSQDSEFETLIRPRKEKQKMKPQRWSAKIAKGAVPAGHHLEIWDSLVKKSEAQARAGKYKGRADVCQAKLLEQDFREGGVLIGYLQQGDKAMSEATRVAKQAAQDPWNGLPRTRAEEIMDSRAEVILKHDPRVSYPAAIQKVLEQDPSLYTAYCNEMRQTEPARIEKIAKRRAAKDGPDTTLVGAGDRYVDDDEEDEDDSDEDEEERDNSEDTSIMGNRNRLQRRAQMLAKRYGLSVASRAECPNCENLINVAAAIQKHACPICGTAL
jgi:hypothetical protein